MVLPERNVLTREFCRSSFNWWLTVVWLRPSTIDKSLTHISLMERAVIILIRVLSLKILKKLASFSSASTDGMYSFMLFCVVWFRYKIFGIITPVLALFIDCILAKSIKTHKKGKCCINTNITKFCKMEGKMNLTNDILLILLLSVFTSATDTNLNTNTNFLLLLLLVLSGQSSCGCNNSCGCNSCGCNRCSGFVN